MKSVRENVIEALKLVSPSLSSHFEQDSRAFVPVTAGAIGIHTNLGTHEKRLVAPNIARAISLSDKALALAEEIANLDARLATTVIELGEGLRIAEAAATRYNNTLEDLYRSAQQHRKNRITNIPGMIAARNTAHGNYVLHTPPEGEDANVTKARIALDDAALGNQKHEIEATAVDATIRQQAAAGEASAVELRKAALEKLAAALTDPNGPLNYERRANHKRVLYDELAAEIFARAAAVRAGLLSIYGVDSPKLPDDNKPGWLYELSVWLHQRLDQLERLVDTEQEGIVAVSLAQLIDGKIRPGNHTFALSHDQFEGLNHVRLRAISLRFSGNADPVEASLHLPNKGEYRSGTRTWATEQSDIGPVRVGFIEAGLASNPLDGWSWATAAYNASPVCSGDARWTLRLRSLTDSERALGDSFLLLRVAFIAERSA